MNAKLITLCLLLLWHLTCNPSRTNPADPQTNFTGMLMNLLGTNSAYQKSQASTQVTGILRDANDEPLPNATLDLSLTQGRSLDAGTRASSDTRTTTDAEGVYKLNLRLGKFDISVTKADGTKLGSFSLDVVNSSIPPTVSTTSTFFKPSGTQISGLGGPAPTLTNLKLESITFPDSTLGQLVNSTISPRIVGGRPSNCTVSPSLPTGLSITGTTCRISGTPTTLQANTTYTVTASNGSGSVTGTLKIAVIVSAPRDLVYLSQQLAKDRSVTISPTTLGGSPPTSCSSSPGLPAGLTINATTCDISGTPTVLQASVNYTITASNSGGSTTANLTISVAILPPSNLTYSGSPRRARVS